MYAAIPLSMQLSSMGALFQNLLAPFSWGMLGGIKVTYDVEHRHLTDKERLVLSVALPLFLGMLTTQLVIDSSRRLYQYNVQVKPLLPPRRRQQMPNPKALLIFQNILFLFPIPLFYGAILSEHSNAFDSFDDWLRAATCYDVAQRLIKGEATGTWQGAWETLTRDFLVSTDVLWNDPHKWERHISQRDRPPNKWKQARNNLFPEGYVQDWKDLFAERVQYLGKIPVSLEDDKDIPRAPLGYTRLLFLYDKLWKKIQTTVSKADKEHAWFQGKVQYFTRQQRSSEPNDKTVKEIRKCVRKYQLFFHFDQARCKGYAYHKDINQLVARMTNWCDQYLDKERST